MIVLLGLVMVGPKGVSPPGPPRPTPTPPGPTLWARWHTAPTFRARWHTAPGTSAPGEGRHGPGQPGGVTGRGGRYCRRVIRTPAAETDPFAHRLRPPGSAAVAVLAGGSGSRVGGSLNKVYLPLAGRRLISWSFTWAGEVDAVGHLLLVVRPEDAELAEQTLRREAPAGRTVELVIGGNTRHGSEQAALDHLAPRIEAGEVDVVAIHDGARPLAGPALFRSVISAAASVGGAVPALPALGVIPADPDGGAAAPRNGRDRVPGLTRVQTPQAFRAAELLRAYRMARAEGYQGTDTASSIERYGELAVQVVAGSRHNLKVTYPHDLVLAERLLAVNHYRMP